MVEKPLLFLEFLLSSAAAGHLNYVLLDGTLFFNQMSRNAFMFVSKIQNEVWISIRDLRSREQEGCNSEWNRSSSEKLSRG
jgi:hypothetical protein